MRSSGCFRNRFGHRNLTDCGAPLTAVIAQIAIKGYKGLEGTYEFDQNGDGLHGYNIVKNEGGRIVFMKRVDFRVQ